MGRRSPSPTAQVRFAWSDRVAAEYRSAAFTQHLALWLIQLGASPDLVRAAARIVDDELTHALLSRRAFERAGGIELAPLVRDTLALTREHEALEDDVVCAVVRLFCLGETVAVPLFAHLRRDATVPVVRRAFDRILRDEVRHRDFGWTALGWLLEHTDARSARPLVEASLPRWLDELEACYGDGLSDGIAAVSDDERAWGVVPAHEFRAILKRTYTRDYAPRFRRLGIAFPERRAPAHERL